GGVLLGASGRRARRRRRRRGRGGLGGRGHHGGGTQSEIGALFVEQRHSRLEDRRRVVEHLGALGDQVCLLSLRSLVGKRVELAGLRVEECRLLENRRRVAQVQDGEQRGGRARGPSELLVPLFDVLVQRGQGLGLRGADL